ncbi:MAG TPA: LysR family transcriptional regulator [Burkholderiales bacterium]|jgi:DNA-binding transcriptional LysR family regulator|nr:LysR family transcriptional regulator [Burkholderiales bacterium]
MDRLTAMELFVRIVETGSFSAVAREMDMTQPTVSKQLSALEHKLKVRLLNRSTRQLSLTEAGSEYYEACKRILDQVRETEANLGRLQGQLAGLLKINTSIALGQMYVGPLTLKFQKLHPEVEVDLALVDRFVDVVEEGVDVAIRIGRLGDSNLVARRLGKTRRVAVATPAYLKKHGVPKTPQELVHHNCILYAYLSTGNEWMFQGPDGQEIRVKVSGNFRTNNGEAIRQAVLNDLGVAVTPEWIAQKDIESGAMRAILTNFAPTLMDIHAVYPSGRHLSAKVRAYVDFLRAEFQRIPALRAG